MVMLQIMKPLLRRPLMPIILILQISIACAIACNITYLLAQKAALLFAPDGISAPDKVLVLYGIAAQGESWSAARMRALESKLQAVPGVTEVSYAATLPMISTSRKTARVYGSGEHMAVNTVLYSGDNLLQTLGLHLAMGRDFTKSEAAFTRGLIGSGGGGPIIITRALAEALFPRGNALGSIVAESSHGGDQGVPLGTVVGVVEHLMQNSLDQNNNNLDFSILLPGIENRWPVPIFAIRVSASGGPPLCPTLKTLVDRDLKADMPPGSTVYCDTISSLRDDMLAGSRASVWLLSTITLVVLIVTVMGIFGLTAYWVQQRRRSIGIRRAVGAKRTDILYDVLLENIFLVGMGAVLGMIGAFALNMLLMQQYEMSKLPLSYLPIGAASLLTVGILAAVGPAVQASNVPPIVATRSI